MSMRSLFNALALPKVWVLLVLSGLSLGLLSSCSKETTINEERLTKFISYLDPKIQYGLVDLYKGLAVLLGTPNSKIIPQSADQVYAAVVVFYGTLAHLDHAFSLANQRFVASGYLKFKYLKETCTIAQEHPEEYQVFAKYPLRVAVTMQEFCQQTIHFGKLLVDSFSSHQIQTLNAKALFNEGAFDLQTLQEMIKGKYNFNWSSVQIPKLYRLDPLGQYIDKNI